MVCRGLRRELTAGPAASWRDRQGRAPGPGETRDLAYTTVLTVLDRLARKGVVERDRDGRAWRYRPVASREELTARAMRQPLGVLNGVGRRAAMLHFVDTASAEELDDLRAALADVEARATAPTGRD